MRLFFVLLVLFLASCSKDVQYKDPKDIAIAFWTMALLEPSKCEDFMGKHMAVSFARGLFAPASKEQAKVFCQGLKEYKSVYSTSGLKNITAQIDIEYEKDKRYLVAVLLHYPLGQPIPIRTYVVKIKERWYVVP